MAGQAQNFDFHSHNLEFWNERGPVHAESPDYFVEKLVEDPSFVSYVVDFDRKLLGDISGLDCIHLQCHIGTDTLSLARLGAASVVGLDFSDASIAEARRLAERTAGNGGSKLRFVNSDLYSALGAVQPESFDLVFTGVGALPWISSIKKWAEVVSGLLKPGGRLFIREGHPVLYSLDDEDHNNVSFRYPYFETNEPSICYHNANATYVKIPDGKVLKPTKTGQFSHGLGETVQSLLDQGLCITGLREHDTVPWNALPGHMIEGEKGEWSLAKGSHFPLSYTLQAIKPIKT